ncbi:MAG: hypothetical protein IPP90_04145 [Gemmatimonadaceae bacterium]|nr:hypothetical protein [Gemmatimonadaceae bacterium]
MRTNLLITLATVAGLNAATGAHARAPSVRHSASGDSLVVVPRSMPGGQSALATIVLAAEAPTGGVTVAIAVAPGARGAVVTGITVPSTVTIAAGSKRATFRIATTPVATDAAALITAVITPPAGMAMRVVAPLTVLAPVVVALTPSATRLVGGATATVRVQLSGPAPASGMGVALSVSNALATVTGGAVVAAGSESVVIPLATRAVSQDVDIRLVAGTTVQMSDAPVSPPINASVSLLALRVTSVTLAPATVAGGAPSTATITLNLPVAGNPLEVTMVSSVPGVTVPSSVRVPAGSNRVNAAISTSVVDAPLAARISASAVTADLPRAPAPLGGVVDGSANTVITGESTHGAFADLTVTPVARSAGVIASATLSSVQVAGGSAVLLSIVPTSALTAAVVVQMVCSRPDLVVMPASVTLEPGRTAQVRVIAARVSTPVTLTVVVSIGTERRAVTLLVNPP